MLNESDLIDRLLEAKIEIGHLRERLVGASDVVVVRPSPSRAQANMAEIAAIVDSILSRPLDQSKIQLIKLAKKLDGSDLRSSKEKIERSELWIERPRTIAQPPKYEMHRFPEEGAATGGWAPQSYADPIKK